MTNTTFTKGDEVKCITGNGRRHGKDYYNAVQVAIGDEGTVTNVNSDGTISVKFKNAQYVVYMNANELEPVSEEARAAIAARIAEEQREITPQEGDILPDDPRLAWMWRKISRSPEVKGYCSTYDNITEKLDLPGREREFNIGFKVDGLSVTARVLTNSTTQGQKIIAEKFPEAVFN